MLVYFVLAYFWQNVFCLILFRWWFFGIISGAWSHLLKTFKYLEDIVKIFIGVCMVLHWLFQLQNVWILLKSQRYDFTLIQMNITEDSWLLGDNILPDLSPSCALSWWFAWASQIFLRWSNFLCLESVSSFLLTSEWIWIILLKLDWSL